MLRSSFWRLFAIFFILTISLFFPSNTSARESQVFGPYCMETLPVNICDDFHFNPDCSVNTAPAATPVYTGTECCNLQRYSNCRQLSKTKQGATGGNACVYLGTFQCYDPTPTPTPTPISPCSGIGCRISVEERCNAQGTGWETVNNNVCVAASSCTVVPPTPTPTPTPTPFPTPTPTPSCTSYLSCQACQPSDSCGWCFNSGTCKHGTFSGSDDGLCSGENWAWSAGSCTPTPTPTLIPTPTPVTCLVTTSPSILNLVAGGTPNSGIVTASVTGLPSGKTISQMLFGSYNTAIATVNPTSNPNSPYTTTVTAVAPGTTAVWGTAKLSDGDTTTCQSTGTTDTDVIVSTPTPTPTLIPTPTPVTCQVTTSPSVYNLSVGGTGTVTASVTSGLGLATVSQMRFGSYNTAIATVNPTSNPNSPYTTTVTAVAPGTTAVWGTADLSDGRTCQSTGTTDTDINVSTPAPTVYSISGTFFVDTNGDGKKNVGEPNYTGQANVSYSGVSGSGTVTNSAGPYSISNLPQGQYTLTFAGLPGGSSFTYPPTSIIVNVGSGCSVPVTSEASCSLGSISNLNAGVTNNSSAWFQSKGSDMRWDSGFTNTLPLNKYASIVGTGGMPGIIFSGPNTPVFGQGSASSTNWQVSGSSADKRDVFTDTHNLVPTSYRFLLETADASSIAKKGAADLCSGSSDSTNCTLTPGLVNGVYKIDGNLNLNGAGYTFGANKNFVILINGNLTINEKILVPNTSTVIFSASGNVTVSRTVGESSSTSCDIATHAGCTIEGLYSADNNFVADGTNNCAVGPDLRLNVAGSIIANAGRSGALGFVNNRTLCGNNISNPSVSFVERPDFILNYPSLVRQTTRAWQEVSP